ncbi:MAG: STAS domain-containing protein [Sphingobacteriales bacterium JAD_PAG50586_3]|nr:MAG: STAS domain-containing protein [Sphingobacteriales bacterium JAD_PAG50586_3]
MTFDYKITPGKGFHTVVLKGYLFDKSQTGLMYEQLDELIAQGNLYYLIDLGGLDNLGSGGIQVMLHILTKARNRGGEALVTNPRHALKTCLPLPS